MSFMNRSGSFGAILPTFFTHQHPTQEPTNFVIEEKPKRKWSDISRGLSIDTTIARSESTGGMRVFPHNRAASPVQAGDRMDSTCERAMSSYSRLHKQGVLTAKIFCEEEKPGNGNVWDIGPIMPKSVRRWDKPDPLPVAHMRIPAGSLVMDRGMDPLPKDRKMYMRPKSDPSYFAPALSSILGETESSSSVASRRLHPPGLVKTGPMRRKESSQQDSDRLSEVLGSLVDPEGDKLKARTRWMSSIPNDTQLSHLSVPGSHDTAAYNYKGEWNEFQNRQSIPIFRQLDAGIRALDLRYTCHRDKLRLAHSEDPDLGEELEDVIWGLNAWLQIRPSETIFVSLKLDESCAQDGNAKGLMKELLDDTANFWVDNPTTRTTLEEARGKLILLRRFPSDEARGFDLFTGLSANSSYFCLPLDPKRETFAEVEDFFLLRGHPRDAEQQVDLKLDSIIAHLEQAQKARMEELDHLYITFSSEIGDQSDSHLHAGLNPKVLALGRGDISGVNGNLAEWLEHSSRRPVGIIFMDFATVHRNVPDGGDKDARDEGDDLIQAIINMNLLT